MNPVANQNKKTTCLRQIGLFHQITVLNILDDFRTIDWVIEYPFPDVVLDELQCLLK